MLRRPLFKIALILLLPACVDAHSAIKLKLSHNVDDKAPVHKAMEYFAERVKYRTSGQVIVRIYPNAQLGNQRESMELLQYGALDMVKSNASSAEAFAPAFGAFNIPYLFKDREHYYQALLHKDIGGRILQSSAKVGLIGITYYDSGARSFYTKKRIDSPSDLEGLKIRVQPSATSIRMVELMGAAPTPISYGELYTALQQGVVDGAENNIDSVTTYKHGEIAKFYGLDEHTMIPDVLFIGQRSWNKLNPEQQQALLEAGRESMLYMKNIWSENINRKTAIAREMGVTVYQVDKNAFRKSVEPMRKDALKNPVIGPYLKSIAAIEQ